MVGFALMLGGFGVIGAMILIWLNTKSGKKWIESL